jgi:hypothetical protein
LPDRRRPPRRDRDGARSGGSRRTCAHSKRSVPGSASLVRSSRAVRSTAAYASWRTSWSGAVSWLTTNSYNRPITIGMSMRVSADCVFRLTDRRAVRGSGITPTAVVAQQAANFCCGARCGHMQCGKQGPVFWMDRGSCRGGFQTRPGAIRRGRDHPVAAGLLPARYSQRESVGSHPRIYRANNPARWADDPENISRAISAEAGRV